MNVSIEDLRTFNTCPLLFEQRGFYQERIDRSRILLRELGTVFNNLFYQTMRGRKINTARVGGYWKEAVKKAQEKHPDLGDKDFQFPAQCLAIFMDMYLKTADDEEVVGPGVPFEVPISQNVIVQDVYPLLTRTNYGTRITIFEFLPTILPDIHYSNDFFYSVYAHAYRREFGKNEFSIRICNLGDGKSVELVKGESILKEHVSILESLGDELSLEAHKVPSLSHCPSCVISTPCHVRRYAAKV